MTRRQGMAPTIAKIAIILALAAGAQAFLACPPAEAQDGLKVSQASRGSSEVPNWDQARLELHGPPLPVAAGDPRRHLEVAGSPAGPVNAMEKPFSAKGK